MKRKIEESARKKDKQELTHLRIDSITFIICRFRARND